MFDRRLRHTMFDHTRALRATARHGHGLFEGRRQHTLLSAGERAPHAGPAVTSRLRFWQARYAVGQPPAGWRQPTAADVARLGLTTTPTDGVA